MKWHLAYRHEMPAALDALGKDYEAKTTSLKEENSQLKQKLNQLQNELSHIKVTLSEEKAEKLEALKQRQRLEQERNDMIIALAGRDMIIRDRLHIELPNPFAP